MKLYKTVSSPILEYENEFFQLGLQFDWDQLINRDDLYYFLKNCISHASPIKLNSEDINPLAPIGNQEVWAAGVTYYSSRLARMEESKDAGGGDFYSRVYVADRPEIFFKATPARTVGPDSPLKLEKTQPGMYQSLNSPYLFLRVVKLSATRLAMMYRPEVLKGKTHYIFPKPKHLTDVLALVLVCMSLKVLSLRIPRSN